jgi:hypothetical protein
MLYMLAYQYLCYASSNLHAATGFMVHLGWDCISQHVQQSFLGYLDSNNRCQKSYKQECRHAGTAEICNTHRKVSIMSERVHNMVWVASKLIKSNTRKQNLTRKHNHTIKKLLEHSMVGNSSFILDISLFQTVAYVESELKCWKQMVSLFVDTFDNSDSMKVQIQSLKTIIVAETF